MSCLDVAAAGRGWWTHPGAAVLSDLGHGAPMVVESEACCAQATGAEVLILISSLMAILVRRRLGGGAGGRLVLAGGAVVMLRVVSGLFRLRCCGGKEGRPTA